MTVIAWDGSVLAADKQTTYDGMRSEMVKVTKHEIGDETLYIAICGITAEATRLKECLLEEDNDRFSGENFDGGSLVVVKKSTMECFVFDGRLTGFKVKAPFSRGIGAPYAKTAMVLGQNAVQSVITTCKLCDGCGIGVDAYDVVSGQHLESMF